MVERVYAFVPENKKPPIYRLFLTRDPPITDSDIDDLRRDLGLIFSEISGPETYMVRKEGGRYEFLGDSNFSPPERAAFILRKLGYISRTELPEAEPVKAKPAETLVKVA